jgi:transcriptional regulator with XRE-family HTH domain
MTSVGNLLKTERERQGRKLAEIAEELCITQRYLRSIEQDDLKSLPGSFFYKSFVRQYAAVLGVDDALLRAGIEALTATLEPVPLPGADPTNYQNGGNVNHFSFENPFALTRTPPPVRDVDPIVKDGNRRYFPDRRIGMSMAGLVLVVLACSGFYSWWTKAPSVSAARRSEPARGESSTIVPVKATATAEHGPSVDVTTTVGPDGLNHVMLNLSATEKTWLSVTSDGKEIFSGILEPSQTKTLTGLDVAKMRVGNAGGLEVRWNGKAIGPIGPRGQVRVVLFTPENFQILAPSQPL